MVVRLHTTDGRTKVYNTDRGEGGGEYGPSKYVTKCGMEWKFAPRPYETCDHIDCALDIQKRMSDGGPMGFLIFVVWGIVELFMMKDAGLLILAVSGFTILMGVWSLINGSKAQDKLNELTEYKSRGTINGMKAYIDHALAELAELVTATECIGYGHALHNMGRYDEAIKAYDKAIVLNPRLADAWYNKGIILGNQGKYDRAILAYDKAIEIDPKDPDIWYYKGMALRSLGRSAEPDVIFADVKRELNSKGNDLFDLEKYAEAIKAYDMALEADPKYMNAWINKGTAFFKLGMYQEAVASFNQVIEIDPRHADAWNRKGVVLKKMGCKIEAADAVAKSMKLGYTGPYR